MTEVTRVPLQPIAKGSLTKLWLAVGAAVLIAAGVAWAAAPQGIELTTLVEGSGPNPTEDDVVFVNYVGKLEDGTVFDQSQPIPIPIEGIFPEGNPFPLEEGATIPGFAEGLKQVQRGGSYVLEIPSELAYGSDPQPGSPIPPNADLTFELEVIDFMSQAEFEQRLQALQQMMMQQQGALGAPGIEGQAPPPTE